MTYLAFQNLWQQKFRLALTVTGVALAMGLILLLNGFETGVYRQVTAYLDHTAADYVVAEESVKNLLGVQSLLPGDAEALARGVPGIARRDPAGRHLRAARPLDRAADDLGLGVRRAHVAGARHRDGRGRRHPLRVDLDGGVPLRLRQRPAAVVQRLRDPARLTEQDSTVRRRRSAIAWRRRSLGACPRLWRWIPCP